MRAHGHAVEVGHRAVAVVADREPPAVRARMSERRSPRSPRMATAAKCTLREARPHALDHVELLARSRRRAWPGRRADGAPARRSWQTLSTRGPRTAHAGRWPLAPSSGGWRRWRRRRGDSASGTANGGSCLPAAIPREPPPLVAQRVDSRCRRGSGRRATPEQPAVARRSPAAWPAAAPPAAAPAAASRPAAGRPARRRTRAARSRGGGAPPPRQRPAAAAPPPRGTRSATSARSASTSTAGSTTSTPSSETVRSTTVTRPKSRSMRMSETTSTAKPAIAVTPEASTARAGRAVGALERRARRPGRPRAPGGSARRAAR